MNKLPSTSCCGATPLRRDPNRSRWLAVLTTGIVTVAISSMLIFSEGILGGQQAYAFSKRTRQAGAVTFHEKGCEHCHGVDGIGTDRGPDLSDVGKRWKKERIEQQIRAGGGGMPPFGDALAADEVRDLVDYLRSKRKAVKAVHPPVTAKTPADDSGM